MTLNSVFKNVLYVVLLITILPLIPTITSGISSLYSKYFDPRTTVAVVPIKGVLDDSSALVRQLHAYFKDPQVKAVLLKIDCCGSKAGTGQAVYSELMMLKQEHPKPVISLVENICASGGYYIACASDHIIASPAAMVGSIGIRFSPFAEFQLKDFIEQYKIHYKPMQAGQFKTSGDIFTDRKPEETALLQALLDDAYDQFITDVAKNRKLSVATAPEWANGKIFTGRQAMKLGLVDQLGSVSDAIKTIKEKTLIEGEIRWIRPTQSVGFLKSLMGDKGEDDPGILSSAVTECCRTLEQRYLTPGLV